LVGQSYQKETLTQRGNGIDISTEQPSERYSKRAARDPSESG